MKNTRKTSIAKASLVTGIIAESEIFVSEKYSIFTINNTSKVFAIPVYRY